LGPPRKEKVHTQLEFTGSQPRAGRPALQYPNQVPSRRAHGAGGSCAGRGGRKGGRKGGKEAGRMDPCPCPALCLFGEGQGKQEEAQSLPPTPFDTPFPSLCSAALRDL